MDKIQFKCTLLTDVILNVRSASEGAQSTLDFIPGNCFLGIVAKGYGQFDSQQRFDLFHSGKVRYGDAHPCAGAPAAMLSRTLRIPAAFFYPKNKKPEDACYIHHFYARSADNEGDGGAPQQLKQCRAGFYCMDGVLALKAATPKSFAIKSAYDRVQRRSMDEQMYGYESLDKGGVFLFEVETDEPALLPVLRKHLVGRHRVGRSRSAQYGLVDISETAFSQVPSRTKTVSVDGKNKVVVYADGRLIFIDENGMPTFRPTAADFGLDGEIDWANSQVRTFQYAPWNSKRQTRDADRCGIEKGSVFVVDTNACPNELPTYVGAFRNEGFGRVIFNPEFLEPAPGTNGKAKIQFAKDESKETKDSSEGIVDIPASSPLMKYLGTQYYRSQANAYIYKAVNEFVNQHGKDFKGDSFASQWGAIRAIAMKCHNVDDLTLELFTKEVIVHHTATSTDPEDEDRRKNIAYLGHGIAMEKWTLRGKNRIALLKNFIKDAKEKGKKYHMDLTVEAVVNLASEMAKICRK